MSVKPSSVKGGSTQCVHTHARAMQLLIHVHTHTFRTYTHTFHVVAIDWLKHESDFNDSLTALRSQTPPPRVMNQTFTSKCDNCGCYLRVAVLVGKQWLRVNVAKVADADSADENGSESDHDEEGTMSETDHDEEEHEDIKPPMTPDGLRGAMHTPRTPPWPTWHAPNSGMIKPPMTPDGSGGPVHAPRTPPRFPWRAPNSGTPEAKRRKHESAPSSSASATTGTLTGSWDTPSSSWSWAAASTSTWDSCSQWGWRGSSGDGWKDSYSKHCHEDHELKPPMTPGGLGEPVLAPRTPPCFPWCAPNSGMPEAKRRKHESAPSPASSSASATTGSSSSSWAAASTSTWGSCSHWGYRGSSGDGWKDSYSKL